MFRKPKILAFAGSLREHSYSKRVVQLAARGAETTGAEITLVNLRDYPMPLYDQDDHERNGFDENALKFQKLLSAHDGFLIASPEYNGSLPGALKNAIDWASRKSDDYGQIEVFRNKFAAIMSVSPGAFGGIRCLSHLRGVLTILQVNVLPSEIAVAHVGKMFEENSTEMTDEKTRGTLENLGASLARMIQKNNGEVEAVRGGN